MKTFNILAAEDEPLHAKMLAKKIELMEGYSLMHIFDTGEEVLKYCKLHGDDIDLILLDILLDGKWDGIETTKEIRKVRNVPIIFLTSLQDRSTFEKAKEGFPYAYLTKPFDVTDLQRAMELALQHSARQENPKENYFNDDTFFVRVGNKLVKLRWEEIAWLSVDGKYTRLNLGLGRGYEVRLPLKDLEDKALRNNFFRIHRGLVINLNYLDSFDKNSNEVSIKGMKLPVGRSFRDDLLNQLNLIG